MDNKDETTTNSFLGGFRALNSWPRKTGSNTQQQNHIMKVRHQGDQAVAVVGSITHGIKGYSIDETLASFSHRAAILLDRIVEI